MTGRRGWWVVVGVGIAAVPWLRGAADPPPAAPSPVKAFAFRLAPGQDLKKELLAFAARENIRAGAVLTCVGSLTDVSLRFANREEPTARKGHFEIVSLVGTLDPAGGHLHLCVADRDGVAFGGHLMDGCRVYTTAEVVVGELSAVEFRREVDPTFGYRELVVRPRAGGAK